MLVVMVELEVSFVVVVFFFLMGFGNAVQQRRQMNAEFDSCRAYDMIQLLVYVNFQQRHDLVGF